MRHFIKSIIMALMFISGKILPYPFDGRHFDYDSKDAPVLGRFNGSEDLMLHLPPPLTVDQVQ